MTECFNQLQSIEIFTVLAAIWLLTVICIVICYIMGRNSAGQPVKAQVEPKPDVIKKQDTDEPEGDYFSDEIPSYSDRPQDEERIKTV